MAGCCSTCCGSWPRRRRPDLPTTCRGGALAPPHTPLHCRMREVAREKVVSNLRSSPRLRGKSTCTTLTRAGCAPSAPCSCRTLRAAAACRIPATHGCTGRSRTCAPRGSRRTRCARRARCATRNARRQRPSRPVPSAPATGLSLTPFLPHLSSHLSSTGQDRTATVRRATGLAAPGRKSAGNPHAL